MCENCKEHPAIIHLTEIVNNTKKQAHLCEHCAEEQGLIKQQMPIRERRSGASAMKNRSKSKAYLDAGVVDESGFLCYLLGLPKTGTALASIQSEERGLWGMECKQARPELEAAIAPFCRLLVAACGTSASHVAEAMQTATARMVRKHTGRRSTRPPRPLANSHLLLHWLQAATNKSSRLYAEIASRRRRNQARFARLVRPEWYKLRHDFPVVAELIETAADCLHGSRRRVLRLLYKVLPLDYVAPRTTPRKGL